MSLIGEASISAFIRIFMEKFRERKKKKLQKVESCQANREAQSTRESVCFTMKKSLPIMHTSVELFLLERHGRKKSNSHFQLAFLLLYLNFTKKKETRPTKTKPHTTTLTTPPPPLQPFSNNIAF